ncbi:MAG: T9SS C-terminal target domain-containing protein, partial [Prevotella sp.]|nr:T9SS C-terminal target domain-containing protein [Prevotella sp.]
MVDYKKILFILLFVGFSLSATSGNSLFPSSGFSITDEQQDKTMSLEVIINGTSKIIMENVPLTGYLEVYSILGVRVTNVNLKTCTTGCSIDL